MRALTLNVYSIEDEKVQSFMCARPASAYFQEIAVSLVEQCQVRRSLLWSICLLQHQPNHP